MADIVLIHGGSTSGRIWAELTPHLNGRAIAPDLPGRNNPAHYASATFSQWAQSIIDQMDRAEMESAILVAHSMGGGTMAAIARLFPSRVKGIVCFGAVVPPDGAPFLKGLNASQQDLMHHTLAEGSIVLPRPVKAAADEGDPLRRLMRDANSTEALLPFFEPVSLQGFAITQLGLVRLLRDRAIELERQDCFIERLRALGPVEIRNIDAGHMAMVTHPRESAVAINDLCDTFEQRRGAL